jgi:hypothetical protein
VSNDATELAVPDIEGAQAENSSYDVGTAAADPWVVGAYLLAIDQTRLVVIFSERMGSAGLTNTASYVLSALDGGSLATITSVTAPGTNNGTSYVLLQLSAALQASRNYRITVSSALVSLLNAPITTPRTADFATPTATQTVVDLSTLPLGSLIKYALFFSAASYVVRTEIWQYNGSTWVLINTESTPWPASGSLSPTTEYFMGGGPAATDLLSETFWGAVWTGGNGSIVINDRRVEMTSNDQGIGIRRRILWEDPLTTLDGGIFGFYANDPAPPGGSQTSVATAPPLGQVPLQYPPTDDTLDRQPVVAGHLVDALGAVEATIYTDTRLQRDLAWDLLRREVAHARYLDMNISRIAVEELLSDHVAAADALRIYLDEVLAETDPDSYEGTYRIRPPYANTLRRNQRWLQRWNFELRLTRDP